MPSNFPPLSVEPAIRPHYSFRSNPANWTKPPSAGPLDGMTLSFRRFDLELRHLWAISTDLGGDGGKTVYPVVLVDLKDSLGRVGIGEASPSSQYHESVDTVSSFLSRIEPGRLSFDHLPESMSYLESVAAGNFPAKCAINLALLDGAARAAGKPLHGFLGLGFREGAHLTSFTIGIDTPESMAAKTQEAEDMPVLKLKMGSPRDRENFAAVRGAAPGKPLRRRCRTLNGWRPRVGSSLWNSRCPPKRWSRTGSG